MANFYKLELNRTEWEIPDIYQQLQSVGSGAYGQVCKGKLKWENCSNNQFSILNDKILNDNT